MDIQVVFIGAFEDCEAKRSDILLNNYPADRVHIIETSNDDGRFQVVVNLMSGDDEL